MSGKNEAAVIALACQIVKLRDRARIWKQTALTHENEAMSARADAVARAEADRVRIEGLAKELRLERETCTETADLLNRESEKVRGLSVQAQDQRSEIERLRDEAAKYKTERDHFYQREGIEAKKRMDVEEERDALRAEVAALKQHPVKVGEWVRRLVPSPACDVGTVAKAVHVDDDTSEIEYDVKRIDGQHGVWFAKNCEPCDPPIVKREPTIGDTVRLVKDEAAKYKTERDHFYQREGIEAKKRMDVEDERDALRAEVAALQERLRASITRGDFAQMEVAQLKSQTPKQHPAKVAAWVRRTDEGYPDAPTGYMAQVLSVTYRVRDQSGSVVFWYSSFCEPCDPPATHDTPEGRSVAESVIRDARNAEIVVGDVVRATFWKPGQMSTVTQILPDGRLILEVSSEPWRVDEVVKLTRKCVGADEAWTDVLKVTTCEPVAEEFKVGDVVKVRSASGDITSQSDVGKIGEVLQLDSQDGTVRLSGAAGWVDQCDVRKVTT